MTCPKPRNLQVHLTLRCSAVFSAAYRAMCNTCSHCAPVEEIWAKLKDGHVCSLRPARLQLILKFGPLLPFSLSYPSPPPPPPPTFQILCSFANKIQAKACPKVGIVYDENGLMQF